MSPRMTNSRPVTILPWEEYCTMTEEKSALVPTGECTPINHSVREQLSYYKRWKRKHSYGMKLAESAFSSFKRTFGGSIKSIKWKNMENELLLKTSKYNAFMRMNP